MTNEYNEGDLVSAVKGETEIRGRVSAVNPGHWLNIGGYQVSRIGFDGYTITVIENAKPEVELPTEPGTVIRFHGVFGVYQLFKNGKWLNSVKGERDPETPDVLAGYRTQGFDILEPRAVTAKAVIERLASWWEFGPPKNFADEFDQIAQEFGVSND